MPQDLFVGYFNQSLIGGETSNGGIATSSDRFGRIRLGLLSHCFMSTSANVKSAQLRSQMAKTNSEYYQIALQGQYRQQLEEIAKFQGKLLISTKKKLSLKRNLILNNAEKALKMELLTMWNISKHWNYQALNLKFNYINTLNGYDSQAVINLEFLIGQ